jgi:cyclase
MDNSTKRIIPCLDVKDGRVVKGVNFIGLQDAGDPVEMAERYNSEGADELTFLDITASHEKRGTMVNVVKQVAERVFIPLTVGGGISKLEDIYNLLNVGCDKVSLNSSAVKNPNLINEASKRFGSSTIVIAVDVKNIAGEYFVFINGGRINTGLKAKDWLSEVRDRGAGEILLTSMDQDGTKSGFDLNITEFASRHLDIPVIASGGAGNINNFIDIFKHGASAALAASIFHYREIDIGDLKNSLKAHGIGVRIVKK